MGHTRSLARAHSVASRKPENAGWSARDRGDRSEQLDQASHAAGPARLTAGSYPGTVVAVEVFVEQDQVSPARIGLELGRAAVNGAAPVWVTREDSAKAV